MSRSQRAQPSSLPVGDSTWTQRSTWLPRFNACRRDPGMRSSLTWTSRGGGRPMDSRWSPPLRAASPARRSSSGREAPPPRSGPRRSTSAQMTSSRRATSPCYVAGWPHVSSLVSPGDLGGQTFRGEARDNRSLPPAGSLTPKWPASTLASAAMTRITRLRLTNVLPASADTLGTWMLHSHNLCQVGENATRATGLTMIAVVEP